MNHKMLTDKRDGNSVEDYGKEGKKTEERKENNKYISGGNRERERDVIRSARREL
jgi:hypothetical protein